MSPLVKVSLRYGALAGFVGSLLLIILYYLGRHPLLIPLYFDFRIVLLGVFIFFCLREVRDYHYGGILYFWQGVIGSFLLTIGFAVITSLMLMAFAHLVPSFLSDYISLTLEQMRSLPDEVIERIGEDVYNRNLELLPGTTAPMLGFTYLVQSFVISLFISLILSVLLRRQPQT